MFRPRIVLLAAALLLTPLLAHAADPGPQNVVREFCRLDANGARLSGRGWRDIASVVAWPLDPAWDHVLFITGYQIGTTRALDEGKLAVDVDYGVVGEATAFGFEAAAYTDRVTFILDTPDEINWHIVAPMTAPRVFASRVSAEEIVATLKGEGGGFVSNSLFISRLMQAGGWDVAYERVADLASGHVYGEVEEPQPGDVVVYTQDDTAYHAGVLGGDGRLASSSLNGGIVRTTLNVFLGELRYLRLLGTPRLPTPTTPTE